MSRALLWAQLVACAVTLTFTVVLTAIIGYAIHATIGFRVPPEVEDTGIDEVEHGETAYVSLTSELAEKR